MIMDTTLGTWAYRLFDSAAGTRGCAPDSLVSSSTIDFGVRVHDLRHAHASWLPAGGADLKGVMDRMGHAQIQTTQKYLHTLPDTDQKNLDALTRMTGRSDRMS
jgi:integrase